MNLNHLGDSKDVFKRGLIEIGKSVGLCGPTVLPMFTSIFSDSQIEVYCKLLGVPENYILNRDFFFHASERSSYFESSFRRFYELKKKEKKLDIFIDPDSGVFSKSKSIVKNRKRLFYSDLEPLLPRGSDHLVMIYDECLSRTQERSDIVRDKLETFEAQGFVTFCYFNTPMNSPNVVFAARPTSKRFLKIFKKLIEIGVPKFRLPFREDGTTESLLVRGHGLKIAR